MMSQRVRETLAERTRKEANRVPSRIVVYLTTTDSRTSRRDDPSRPALLRAAKRHGIGTFCPCSSWRGPGTSRRRAAAGPGPHTVEIPQSSHCTHALLSTSR